MKTLQRNIEFRKTQHGQAQNCIKDGTRLLKEGDREYVQGPAFIKQRKKEARAVCARLVSQGIPSFVAEGDEFYVIWMSKTHAFAESAAPSSLEVALGDIPWKKYFGFSLPALIAIAFVGVTLKPPAPTCNVMAGRHPISLEDQTGESYIGASAPNDLIEPHACP